VIEVDNWFAILPAVTLNVAVALLAATETEAGTDTTELWLESETLVPPAGQGAAIVTVQVLDAPEARLVGEHVSEEMVCVTGASKDTEAACEEPFRVPVTVAA
jgi:hypothetical protein